MVENCANENVTPAFGVSHTPTRDKLLGTRGISFTMASLILEMKLAVASSNSNGFDLDIG